MHENDKVVALTKAIQRNSYHVSNDYSNNSETLNHCTMFVIGAAAFLTGFWAVSCLVNIVLQDGPALMLKNLTTAVTGH